MNDEVKISEIQVVPVRPQEGLIGFASFVLDNKYRINNVAIYTKPSAFGYRLVYPSKKIGGQNIHSFYPINLKFGHPIEQAVCEKVKEIFNEAIKRNTA